MILERGKYDVVSGRAIEIMHWGGPCEKGPLLPIFEPGREGKGRITGKCCWCPQRGLKKDPTKKGNTRAGYFATIFYSKREKLGEGGTTQVRVLGKRNF